MFSNLWWRYKSPLQPAYFARAISLLADIFVGHENGDNKQTTTDVFTKYAGCEGPLNLSSDWSDGKAFRNRTFNEKS